MNYPTDVQYTKDHEWIRISGDRGVVGITDFAQGELGDVVFVELPAVGATLQQGKTFGTIEAVKAVSDLYAPVSGEVVEVNKELQSTPELVNKEPYGRGWMVAVKLVNPDERKTLLNAEAYKALVGK